MNAFLKAQPVAAPKKTAKKDDKVVVTIGGLEELAAIDAVMKSLKALRDTIEVDVKTAQKEHFVAAGIALGKRPENFRGVEGIASASCELRARSSASALSEDEQTLLGLHDIPTERVDSVSETFIINPAYLNDGALLERVGNAIGKIKGVPEDFIQKQAAVSKVIVAENGLDALFAKTDVNTVSTLLSVVGTLAVKPTVGDKMAQALAIVQGVLFPAGATAT